MKEMADAIAWEITEITLGTAAISDVTGITGEVAAYRCPTCGGINPFPTVSVAIAFLRF
jgi:hypothetical protein